MRVIAIGLAASAALVFSGSGWTEELVPASAAEFGSELQLDANDPSQELRTYVVQMVEEPAISYYGGIAGYARTAPDRGTRYNSRTSQAQMYTRHLESRQNQALADIGATNRRIYSYQHALNGFAARLTAAEAQKLAGSKMVKQVWEDHAISLDTNNSPTFLGLLDKQEGLRRRHGLEGENVVIGVIDSGIVQEHPSFADSKTLPLPGFCTNPTWWNKLACAILERHRVVKLYNKPKNWHGICQAGEGWSEDDCNNKLIGARWYAAGFLAANTIVEGDFLSPRDSDGHGTHTASTAGGNEVTASLGGTPLARISGIAPRARIAAYKACWQAPNAPTNSCFFSDSAMATDDAIQDGVDVLNFSVGTAAAFNDPQDLAFLRASNAGVFVARSAGNSGPTSAAPAPTSAGEPWVTSVAASTLSGTGFALAARVNSPAAVAGSYAALEGAITKALAASGPITADVVAANPLDACTPIASVAGKIVLIQRGTILPPPAAACAFTVKVENAANAGALAVIVYSHPPGNPKTVMGGTATALTQSIPGVMIDNGPGLALLAELTGGATVNVTLSPGEFITETLTGNIIAGFSSRGPYPTVPDWVKPDITAPGVQILAGNTPEPNDGSIGGFFQYLQGTSMSSPHIAGLGALIREEHPYWSPAMIKSALMTSSRQNVVKENGTTPADPFDFGAGHVDPNKAIDPGLVYDADEFEYLAATCGTATPLISEADCGFLETVGLSLDPSDLNLPSIGIAALPGSQTVKRTVTMVAGPKDKHDKNDKHGKKRKHKATQYKVTTQAPEGFSVEVSPDRLWLRPGDTATYEVTITNVSAPPGTWRFGSLTWEDDEDHVVRSPIAVNAVALLAPAEVTGAGANGTASFDVTFGYTGAYSAAPHGLAGPATGQTTVLDDPNNSFSFNEAGSSVLFLGEVTPGTVYAQWALYDQYTDGNHDLDLYLYYCPNLSCTLVASSGNLTSNERVSVTFPLNNPAINDPYALFVHGFNTQGGLPATFRLHRWYVGASLGNMTVSAPAAATVGETASIEVNWAGLATGASAKQAGAVSHSDAVGVKGLTIVNIENDAGCNLTGCP